MSKIKLYDVKDIIVGFNYREDTYSGKLGFISYSNNGKKLINEASFKRWTNKNIPIQSMNNVLVNGFVLSKANMHQLYQQTIGFVRVFHPEGFDFEIPLDNIYYLMQYTLIDRGQINSECKIYFAENGKPWVLNAEAINSNHFEIVKVASADKIEMMSDLYIGDIVTINQSNTDAIMVNSLKVIHPYSKNNSVFHAEKYLLNTNLKNNRKLKPMVFGEDNDYSVLEIKEKVVNIKHSSISQEKSEWLSKLADNEYWDFITWSNNKTGIVPYNDKAIECMLINIAFKDFGVVNLDDMFVNEAKPLRKSLSSLTNMLISNFILNREGVSYRLCMTKTQIIEYLCGKSSNLPVKNFYVYLIHFGESELKNRDRLDNEKFEKMHIVPIAALANNDVDLINIGTSTKALQSLIIKNGFESIEIM